MAVNTTYCAELCIYSWGLREEDVQDTKEHMMGTELCWGTLPAPPGAGTGETLGERGLGGSCLRILFHCGHRLGPADSRRHHASNHLAVPWSQGQWVDLGRS